MIKMQQLFWTLLSVTTISMQAQAVSASPATTPDCGYEESIVNDPLADVGWSYVEEESSGRASMSFARAEEEEGFEVKFRQLKNFDRDTRIKLAAARRLLEDIIQSEDFEDAVLNHVYNRRRSFADNEGLSNDELLDVLFDAQEPSTQYADGEMDLYLTMTNLPSGVVGEAYVGALGIKVSRTKYAKYSPAQIGRSLLHEWLHNMGFNHDSKSTKRRPYSIPYGVANIFQELALESE